MALDFTPDSYFFPRLRCDPMRWWCLLALCAWRGVWSDTVTSRERGEGLQGPAYHQAVHKVMFELCHIFHVLYFETASNNFYQGLVQHYLTLCFVFTTTRSDHPTYV